MDRNAPSVSIGDFPHDTEKAGFRPTLVVTPKELVSPSLLINPLLSLVATIFSSQNTTIYHIFHLFLG
jgi:hypothetical protein